MARIAQSTLQAHDAKVVLGIQNHLQGITVVLLGVTYSAQSLAALFQSHIDAMNAVASLRGQLAQSVQDLRELTTQIGAVNLALQGALRNQFHETPAVLADFDMAPRKVGKRSLLTNVVAAAKGRNTRAENKPTGKKQRLAAQQARAAEAIANAVTVVMGGTEGTAGGSSGSR